MSGHLPIVDILIAAKSDRDRAEWLSRVPLGVIKRDSLDIGDHLKTIGFVAGYDHFSALLAEIDATRTADGLPTHTVRMATEYTRLAMWGAVKKGEQMEVPKDGAA